MRVRWGAKVSRSFNVTNGVRRGSVLSPLLFSAYIDQLSYSLNQIATGRCVGDDCLNHLVYADDICCFSHIIEVCKNLLISVVITRLLMKSHLILRRLLVLFFFLK